jgi:APA family basic amino acid/polyamine antiporter
VRFSLTVSVEPFQSHRAVDSGRRGSARHVVARRVASSASSASSSSASMASFFSDRTTRARVMRDAMRVTRDRLGTTTTATATATADDARGASGALRKVLTRADLTTLGVGGIIGAGVFVLTGSVAREHAGPAVAASYALSAFTSAVTGLAYAEFAVAMPVAGSAYNYVYGTFGEYAAFLTGCNLALELTIASAAIARGWTSYATAAFGVEARRARVRVIDGLMEIDLIAGIVVCGMTALLVSGAKQTARFNAAVTYASLVVVAVVLLAGAPEIQPSNWTPFAPYGMRGIISGASVVIFAFVGFDTVATCAEEVANPAADLPFGILGSLGICAALYCAMCVVITGMVSYDDIDVNAPFAMAFTAYGMPAIATIVSIGAVAAITTSLLLSMMGQPRVFMVMARDGLLPKWFSRVSEKHGTPANASIFSGAVTGALAVLLDINILAQLVSIGTLSIFCGVNLGLIVSRCAPRDDDDFARRAPALKRAGALFVSSMAFGVDYRARARISWFGAVALAAVVASACSFLTLPMTHAPKTFRAPFVPFLPALGVLLTCVLIAGLGALAWIRYAVYTVLCSVGYLSFAVRRSRESPEGVDAVELAVVDAADADADADADAGDAVTLLPVSARPSS